MTTVAEIALEVFEAVAAELPDVVKDCTLTKKTKGTYNAATDTYTETTATYAGQLIVATGGAIEGGIPGTIKDRLPPYVRGPHDEVLLVRGLSAAPAENDTITVGSIIRTVKAVGDVVGVGDFYIVISIKS